ncbi:30S ribosomal protein S2 [bacterium]|nr:30S ribosomal protein S2 [bacterium]
MANETTTENTAKVEVKKPASAPTKEAPKVHKQSGPVTMRQLLECGVHFGHQTRRWNPKMKKYIFTSRNDIHVIDLQQTLKLCEKAFDFIKETVANRGTILFVGTKKQAQEAIITEATRCKMPYINQRWLGGTLTNGVTIRKSINKLKKYEDEMAKGLFDTLSKKEASRRTKTLTRLKFYLDGIKDMNTLPAAIFIIDTQKEQLAIQEAHKLGIPVVGLVDTNANPNEVTYPIPGNDDAIRAVKLICSVVADAVEAGSHTQEDQGSHVAVDQVADTLNVKEKAN